MQSPDPFGHRQNQPKADSLSFPGPRAAFQGFRPLTEDPAQFFREIWDLQCPGLDKDLRFTLLGVALETVGEASQVPGSPCGFVAVPWVRWKERLELRSINAVKARMARLVEIGLIEVRGGECGPRGAVAPRFRLRWADGGDTTLGTLAPVLQDRPRNPDPWERRDGDTRQFDPRQTDTHQFDTRQFDTHETDTHQFDTHQFDNDQTDTHQTGTYSSKKNKYSNSIHSNQSINPSIIEVNELIEKMTIELNSFNSNQNHSNQNHRTETADRASETGRPAFDVSPWLRADSQDRWPEPLLQGIGEILDPHRIPGLVQRSPWTGEGAWAILQAIRGKGRNLGNQGGTLWNALLKIEKGASWLAYAGPILRQEGWRMEPEDGTPMADGSRSEGGRRLTRMGFSRLPLFGAGLERQQCLRDEGVRRARAVDLDIGEDLDDDYDPSERVEDPMPQLPELEIVNRAEDLSPELKAKLRTVIETYLEASLAARRSPAINRPGFFDTCSRAWQDLGALLEPVLPLELKLTGDYLPTTIRRRAQIKLNILHPLFLAVS